ncbi:ferrichrome-iron receptor [Calothrix sp. HK-06]|nr:ferrichrome-iron receptor [Calothrix sp. HK-06]
MYKSLQLALGLCVTGVIVVTQPAWGNETSGVVKRLNEIKNSATTVKDWLSQTPTSESVISIIGVKANPTKQGLELILQTDKGGQLQVTNRSTGNSFIAEIPNARLRLPSGDAFTFRSSQPSAGITEITVINKDINTIQVTVVGETGLPTVELFDDSEGLIFSLIPVVSTTQLPPEAPQKPEPEKPQSESQSEPSVQDNEPIELVVTGEQDAYRVEEASTATRTDTPLRDIPQSIQVIPRQVIEDQQIQRIADVLRNVSGVTPNIDFAGSDSYTIRGFSAENNLRNGFRQDSFTGFTDTANIERVEVLKGPASVLYGQLEPGGVVNYVTKQPLNEPFYSAQFSAGSYNYYRPAIDISGPLNPDKSVLYRLNAAYENSGGFRNFSYREVFTVAPSLAIKFSENTALNVEYEHTNLNKFYDRALPPVRESFDLPISFVFGDKNDSYEFDANRVSVVLDHKFSRNWRLRSGYSAQTVDTARSNIQPLDFQNPFDEDGRTVRRRYNKVGDYSRDYALQTDLIGKFNTGSIEHEVLLGTEFGRSIFGYPFFISFNVPPLDILNPVYGVAVPTTFDEGNQSESTTNRVGIYIQDQVKISSNVKLLLGGRFDFVRFKDVTIPDLINGSDPETTRRYYEAFSPRIGLVYQPIKPLSIYASYSRAFKPDTFSITATGEPLEPQRSTQYEVGIKGELFNGKLAATLAAYEITKSNVATTDINNIDFTIAAGEVKSRGIELDVAGQILPGWNIIASYSHNDTFVSEDNSLPVGDRLANAPRNTASLWTTYEIQKGNLKGLGIGGGIFFVGDKEATLPNTITIPSYVRTDATIFYRQPNYQVGLSFKNLFDTRYYDSTGFLLTPGAPFTVLGTVSIRF